MELRGLDFTVNKLTSCMTSIQMSMIYAELKKDATVQLVVQEFASGVVPVLQRGGPSPQGTGP